MIEEGEKNVIKILKSFKEKHSDLKPMMTTGAGSGGIVLMYFIKDIIPDIPIYFIDTGFHFKETLQLIERLKELWNLNILYLKNESQEDPVRQHKCCYERKVVPLEKVLKEYDVWISAIRRGQMKARENVEIFTSDSRLREGMKINPIAYWTTKEVNDSMQEHNLPYNELLGKGYTSIGCEPCTSPPKTPGDERSGRWAGTENEGNGCGIHLGEGKA